KARTRARVHHAVVTQAYTGLRARRLTPLKCTRTTEFTELAGTPGRRSTHQAATERTPGPVLLARPTGRPLTGVRQLSHLSHVVSCCLTNPPICGERAVAPTRARAPALA